MKKNIIGAALAALILSIGIVQAQPYGGPYGPPPPPSRPPDMMQRLRWACDRGDRNACIRFGVEIGRHQERNMEWRRAHPDWFGFER